jgi:uncharacterized protein GlcG (DUF336 family)
MTLEQANAAVLAAVAKAQQIGTKMNIAVVDAGANVKAFARMDGAWLGSIDIATVRQLAAKTATIQVEMIHRSVGESPMQPNIAGGNGEQPRTCTSAAKTINGYNRFGNRMAGLPRPMTIGAEG